jgi:hypothetical protein
MTAMIDAMTACQEKGKESKILRAHNIRQKSICERLIGVKEGLCGRPGCRRWSHVKRL